MYQQQQQPWMQPPTPQPPQKNGTFKTLAIIFFVFGFFFHIIGLIPFIGLIFNLIAGAFDICGFIFVCLI